MQPQDFLPDDPAQSALDPNPYHLDAGDPNVARDPVCQRLVDKRIAENMLAAPVNQPMMPIYFCGPTCKELFEQAPEYYGYDI